MKLHDHINLFKQQKAEKYSFTFVSLVNDFIFSFTLLFAHQTFFIGFLKYNGKEFGLILENISELLGIEAKKRRILD